MTYAKCCFLQRNPEISILQGGHLLLAAKAAGGLRRPGRAMLGEQRTASTHFQRAVTGTRELQIHPGFQDLKTTVEEHVLELPSFH